MTLPPPPDRMKEFSERLLLLLHPLPPRPDPPTPEPVYVAGPRGIHKYNWIDGEWVLDPDFP